MQMRGWTQLLPTDRYMELKTVVTRWSSHLAENKEAWIIESEEMNDSAQQVLPEKTPPSKDNDDIAATSASSDSTTCRTKVEGNMDLPKILRDMYHKDAIQEIQHPGQADLDKESAPTQCCLRASECISQGKEDDQDHHRSHTPESWALQPTEDFELHSKGLLVTKHGHRYQIILHLMHEASNE
jgi:hypothetical protein